MQTNNWKSESYRLLAWLGVGLCAGWLLDLPGWGVALAGIGFAVRSIWQLHRLQYWLVQRARVEPPEASGMWGEVLDGLHRMQQKHRRERVRLRALISHLRESFTSLPYAAVIIDPDNNIEWSNAAAHALLGLRYPEDGGRQIVNLVREPAFIRYFEAEDYSQPLELAAPAQHEAYLQVHITFFGKRSRLLLARDVTQTHRLEQMRRDFVANVSHELRTPLTVINGYLETFADTPPGADNHRWRRALDQMLLQSRRMQTLINDLLLLSRLETVTQTGKQQRLAVRPMLDAIREDALAVAGDARDIGVECDDAIALIGQADELHSAIANIVFNAVRYTEPGGRIVMRWQGVRDGACLQVEDNGIGIDAEHIPRLTERFYRVDKSRSMDTGGTGLGLAIVKHVLIRHHARLDIASQPGHGSTFTCVFPASQVAREPRVAHS